MPAMLLAQVSVSPTSAGMPGAQLITQLIPDLRLDGVILAAEPGRSLSAADTSAILGIPVVATVPVRPSIARLIDAGLLAGRPSEIEGLDQLHSTLVRSGDRFIDVFDSGRRFEHGFVRNGADLASKSTWGHEL